MKISARNTLAGTVKHLQLGDVEAEVTIELAAGVEVVATITRTSAETLGLAVGKPAYALVKASNVMVGVD